MGSGNPKSQAAQPHLVSPNRRIRLIIMSEAPFQESRIGNEATGVPSLKKNRADGTPVAATGDNSKGSRRDVMAANRREFLHATVAAGAAAGLAASANADDSTATGLPMRPLGKAGEKVSCLGLGGWHIGSVKSEKEAIGIMHHAIDEGLTFFDNAWDYHDGHSEEVMGLALADPAKRKQVFLMTKNCGRDAKEVQKHLDDSLRRLKTDHLDLVQFHEINYDNDPDWIIERGCLAEVQKAQKAGKVRHIGFTGHKSPHIHLKMLGVYAWDTVQMPVNVCDSFYRSFVKQVLPEATRLGTAVIGMKSLGGGRGEFVQKKVCTAEDAHRFALSQPIATLVTGIDSMDVLKQNIATARNFKSLEGKELEALLMKVKPEAGDGRHEHFKSTQKFDSPYHQKQHHLTATDIGGND
jgi:aryl-alcohol dehydrogenase-like predicted oxidoreductase